MSISRFEKKKRHDSDKLFSAAPRLKPSNQTMLKR